MEEYAGDATTVRTLLIDNYDSYTFNLFQQYAVVNGTPPIVIRNNQLSWDEVRDILPFFDNVVISPGPGRPDVHKDFGVCGNVISHASIPVLGVCLGHQGLSTAFGGKVVVAPEPMHGRVCNVTHGSHAGASSRDGGLFDGIPSTFQVVRYHSLMVAGLPDCLEPFAWSEDDCVMAMRHKERPIWGVQFHPESVCTHYGDTIARNLREISLRFRANRPSVNPPASLPSHIERLSVIPFAHTGTPRGWPNVPAECSRKTSSNPRAVVDGLCSGSVDAGECGLSVLVRRLSLPVMVDAEDTFVALFSKEHASFWLDSSKVEKGLSRFSFMGACNGPRSTLYEYSMRARAVTCGRLSNDGTWKETVISLDDASQPSSFFDFISREQLQWTGVQTLDERAFPKCDSCSASMASSSSFAVKLPFDFACGFVGYFGYELGAECSPDVTCRSRHLAKEPSDMPDAAFVMCDRAIAFDHEDRTVHLLAACRTSSAAEVREARAWMDATEGTMLRLLDDGRADLKEVAMDALGAPPTQWSRTSAGEVPGRFKLERSRETYIDDVTRCLDQIGRGESYELCLTTHLRAHCRPDPLSLYRRLRRTNPAPHAAFMCLPGERALCGSSPELFLRMDTEGVIESKPIKGTLPRGSTPTEDERRRTELATSSKDFSENLMIVDLIRNDLGRVCEMGSVHTPLLMSVESYATVHQLVSTVRGKLRPGLGAVDAIMSCFPPGSMTGAPKQRSIEILDGLERVSRGVYSGCLGFLSLNGAMDFNVIIRTVVVSPSGVSLGAGGAVVAMSDPVGEFGEMLLKARAPVSSVLASMGIPLSSLEVEGLSQTDMAILRPPSAATPSTVSAAALTANVDAPPSKATSVGCRPTVALIV